MSLHCGRTPRHPPFDRHLSQVSARTAKAPYYGASGEYMAQHVRSIRSWVFRMLPRFLRPLLTATRTGAKSSSSRPWCALSPCAHTVAGRLGRESHRGLFARDTRGVNIYTCIHIQVLDHTHIHTTHKHALTRTTSCACTWHNHVQTCVQVVLHAQPLPPPQVGRSIKGEGDAATSARPQ